MIVGCLSVPAGAGGTLLGGYLMHKFSMDRTDVIKFYLICQAVIIPLYFGFFYHCPTPSIQGVNYFDQGTQLNAQSCSGQCSCPAAVFDRKGSQVTVYSSHFEMVCNLQEQITYYSACHAGCQASGSYQNQSFYYGCGCLNTTATTADDLDRLDLNIATKGLCDGGCDVTPLAIILFFCVLFTFMGTMPGLVASLR